MADAWVLLRAFALKAPPEFVVDALLAALRQGETPASKSNGATLAPPGATNGNAALPVQAEQPEQPPVSAPPKRKPGRPPGKRARRARTSRRREVSKAAAPSPDNEAQPNGTDRTALLSAKKAGAAFWRRAHDLNNSRPAALVARTFDLNEALCLDARRIYEIPPGLSEAQVAEFIGAE